jgi:hypothetical protein
MYWYIPDGRNNYDVGCLLVEIVFHKLGYVGLTFLLSCKIYPRYTTRISLNGLFIRGVMYSEFLITM